MDFLSRAVPKFSGPSIPGAKIGLGVGSSMTQAQRELRPYIDEEIEDEETRRKRFQPLKMFFDLLQRGQYMSANVFDEVIEAVQTKQDLGGAAIDALTGLWQGFTGERKGDFENVLGDYTDLDEKKVFKGREGKFLGNMDWADVLGFLGNVLLDPTTYVGLGPSKAARAAAQSFVEDSTRVAAAGLGKHMDELAKIAQGVDDVGKTFDSATLTKLLNEAPEKVPGYLGKFGGDTKRYFDKVYAQSYRDALSKPATELREGLSKKIDDILEWRNKNYVSDDPAQTMLFNADELAEQTTKARPLDWLEDMQNKLPDSYGGGGGRQWSYFGRPVKQFEAGPILQNWDRMKNLVANSKPGQTLSGAWWHVMNNGPVGKFREMFGIRSPHEKMIRHRELQEGTEKVNSEINRRMKVVRQAVDGFSDESKSTFVAANDWAEHLYGKDHSTTVFDVLDSGRVTQGMGEEQLNEVYSLAKSVGSLTRSWRDEFNGWVNAGFYDETGDIVNYLPTYFKDPNTRFKGASALGPQKQKFQYQRQFSRLQTGEQEAAKIAFLFNINMEDAHRLVKEQNLTGFSMDLDELLMVRAEAQAKAGNRVHMIETFREFGIPVHEVEQSLGQALNRPDANWTEIGLSAVEGKGLEGYLFDNEIAGVLGRTMDITDPKKQNMFGKIRNWYTAWWKGLVTMTTGFHARNHFSNETTLWMKQGAKAFDPALKRDAFVGVMAVLRESDPQKFLKELGGDNVSIQRILNRRYGGLTVNEIAREAADRGLISEATHGFDVETVLDKINKKKSAQRFNPGSNKFAMRDVSAKVGSYVENTPKLQSMLIDFDDAVKQGASVEEALEWASTESKKWWIDYNDLTEFERKTMKGTIMPFYTWLRHNITNQVDGILRYPETFSMFPKLEDALSYDDPEFDPDVMPDWMKQLGMFPVGRLEDDQFAMFNPNLPFQDLNKIPLMWEEGKFFPQFDAKEVKDDLINAMHPGIKTAVNMITEKGYDFFYKTELTDTRKAPYVMRLFASNPKILGMIDGIGRLAGKDGAKAYVDDNGKLQIDGKLAKILEDNLPLLRHMDYLLYGLQTVIPGMEEGLETLTGAQDDYEGWEQFFQVLAFYGGVKFKPLDLEESKKQIASGLYQRAQDAKRSDDRRTSQGSTRRATNYDKLVQRSVGGRL